jgi:hypothetical protein
MEFDHEKLDVYRLAVDFSVVADDIANQLPFGRLRIVSMLADL